MEEYPAFSSFRSLMTRWDECLALEEERNSIDNHLNRHQCIFFFKKGDDIFGAPEESRLAFAKMKSQDKDVPKDAKFIALNLIQSLLGQETQSMFGTDDLKILTMMDRDAAVDELMNHKKKKKK